jgi:hypothetical protein
MHTLSQVALPLLQLRISSSMPPMHSALQLKHVVEPLTLVKLTPFVHAMHDETEVLPLNAENVPGGHSVQLVDASRRDEKEPAGQSLHTVAATPSLLMYVPGGHAVHREAPVRTEK